MAGQEFDRVQLGWTLAGLILLLFLLTIIAVPDDIAPEFIRRARQGPVIQPLLPSQAQAVEMTAQQLTRVLLRASTLSPSQQAGFTRIAAQRKERLLQLYEKNASAALELLIPGDVRNRFIPAIQAHIEEQVEINGTLEIFHTDDFVNYSRSEYRHFLRVGEERISLHSDQALLGVMPVISGSIVKVKGAKLGNRLIANGTVENFQVLVEEKPHASEQRVLVILADLTDRKFTTPIAEQKRILDTVNDYYLENSYGDTFFSFTAIGPIDIGISSAQAIEGQRFNEQAIKNAAVAAVVFKAAVDLTQYAGVMIIVPEEKQIGASTVGRIENNLFFVWLTEANFGTYGQPPKVGGIAHELGHGLGLFHANRLECSGSFGTVGPGGCTSVEYGDPFDTMGSGNIFNGIVESPFHMNAYHKSKMGWIGGSDVVTTLGGTYTIEPLETPRTPNGIKLLRLPYDESFYHLEYRQPIGFDKYMWNISYGGALLHFAPRGSNLITIGDLIAVPGTLPQILLPRPLAVNESYVDTHAGYTITVLEATPLGLKVRIQSPFTPVIVSSGIDPAVEGARIAGVPGIIPTVYAGESTLFQVVLGNHGSEDAQNVRVIMSNEETGAWIGSPETAPIITAGGTTLVEFKWFPHESGQYILVAEISPPLPDDTNLGNNKVSLPIYVLPERFGRGG